MRNLLSVLILLAFSLAVLAESPPVRICVAFDFPGSLPDDDSDCPQQSEVLSFDWSIARQRDVEAASGLGPADYAFVRIVKALDKADPELAGNIDLNQSIDEVVITKFRSTTESPAEFESFLTFELSNCRVSAYRPFVQAGTSGQTLTELEFFCLAGDYTYDDGTGAVNVSFSVP